MKTLERNASQRKSTPTTSYLPLNGLSDVTFVSGFGTDATLPCHTADPDLFFSEATEQINQAKALCGGCPVARQCLEGALSRAEPCGVWGGELFDNGRVVAAKRRAGRPRIRIQDENQKIAALGKAESLRSLPRLIDSDSDDLNSVSDVTLDSEMISDQLQKLERAS